MTGPLALEGVLRRDRWVVGACLLVIVALSWSWLFPAARDMYGAMDGLSAWMMAATWDAGYAFRIFLMWTVMMVAMMLPSAAPAILIVARVLRNAGPSHSPVARTNLFVAGYLVVWTAFSAAATAAQALTAWLAWTNPMMESASPWFGAAVLVAAGAWQFTAAKRACLTRCRSPAQFIAEHWRPGAAGALRMGIAHGVYCVGCCWALMALLFVGGVMNLACIGAIALFVLVEKVAPLSFRAAPLAGAALIVAGVTVAARAAMI
ncbi:MAG TPA: DUF2182 domain-containing protein [Nevskiaceae bacterium]|nr:DUF2182 domain-containing protein [Nevskiaceae bacterium]